MHIVVLGAGAIGSLVAGYLKNKGEDVYVVGRSDAVSAIARHDLRISGCRGDFKVRIDAYEMLISKPDLVILATKTQDIEKALKDNLPYVKDALVVTTQNGVQADSIVAKYFSPEKIISSIVMFGATYLEPGKVVHNFEGDWILGRVFIPGPAEAMINVSMILAKAFGIVLSENIRGMKYLKIFVNANNCISALLGVSMQDAFADLQVSRISIEIWKEGFDIMEKAGIRLVSLPGFPVENITRLTSMPSSEAARAFCVIMSNLSKDPLIGSILQSIKRGRSSEIDYINGEFVNLARSHNMDAPLNKKLVQMVHMVEATGEFFTKQQLFENTRGLLKDE